MSDNEIERMPAAREKVAIARNVEFSENLNRLSSKADKMFKKYDEQKPSFDDVESLSKPDEMTIPQAQVVYKELKEGKLPEQLRFFSGGNSELNELSLHAINKLKIKLNKSNKAFLDYPTSDYAREILAKDKIKIHLDTGNIYRGKTNLEKHIHDILIVQQNETKNS